VVDTCALGACCTYGGFIHDQIGMMQEVIDQARFSGNPSSVPNT
jgi:hypothetical protein